MEMFAPTAGKRHAEISFEAVPMLRRTRYLALISFQVATRIREIFLYPCNLSVLNFFIELSRTHKIEGK